LPWDNFVEMESETFTEAMGNEKSDFDLCVCVLASGSKGNAIYVSDGNTSILVDAGFSGIEIERRLYSRSLSPQNLDAILVSHEHSDHIQAVGVLSRRYHLPVYVSLKAQKMIGQLGKVHELRNFTCGSTFQINKLKIHPFSTSHDAEDPVGFTIRHNSTCMGIATDLGIATSMVKEHLKSCALLILESNHDPDMLTNGPYPWPLKQRIKSRTGHLSNIDSKKLLAELLHDRLEYVILAHLSETNNTPQRALEEVAKALNHSKTRLTVARQDVCGPIIYLK
jgi:phosphoribosyl 1,2-cyclic phosphodiesterase